MPTHWSDPKYTAVYNRYNYLLMKDIQIRSTL